MPRGGASAGSASCRSKRLADDEVKRGQYIAEFLAQSEICDEVGIMLADGGDWCLGIFLDRSTMPFRDSEIALLNERLPVFAALHALDIKARGAGFLAHLGADRPRRLAAAGAEHPGRPVARASARASANSSSLILAGHPTATIAERLGITVGTVKNHRRRIYEKLDITTERELFLQFFQHLGPVELANGNHEKNKSPNLVSQNFQSRVSIRLIFQHNRSTADEVRISSTSALRKVETTPERPTCGAKRSSWVPDTRDRFGP